MANHKSSEKRARNSERKRERNRQYLSSVRTAVKKLRVAMEAVRNGTLKDQGDVKNLLINAQSMLAKAAAKGVIHRKNASRRIGRLAQTAKGTTLKTPSTALPKAKAKVKTPAAAKTKPKSKTK